MDSYHSPVIINKELVVHFDLAQPLSYKPESKHITCMVTDEQIKIHGKPKFIAGRLGGFLEFNTCSDYIELELPDSEYTVNVWNKTNDTWTMRTITSGNTELLFYINAKPSHTAELIVKDQLTLGKTDQPFCLSMVSVYSRALPLNEIYQNYVAQRRRFNFYALHQTVPAKIT